MLIRVLLSQIREKSLGSFFFYRFFSFKHICQNTELIGINHILTYFEALEGYIWPQITYYRMVSSYLKAIRVYWVHLEWLGGGKEVVKVRLHWKLGSFDRIWRLWRGFEHSLEPIRYRWLMFMLLGWILEYFRVISDFLVLISRCEGGR